jgi:hypothetical protein
MKPILKIFKLSFLSCLESTAIFFLIVFLFSLISPVAMGVVIVWVLLTIIAALSLAPFQIFLISSFITQDKQLSKEDAKIVSIATMMLYPFASCVMSSFIMLLFPIAHGAMHSILGGIGMGLMVSIPFMLITIPCGKYASRFLIQKLEENNLLSIKSTTENIYPKEII